MREGWTYRKLGEITEYPNRHLKINQLGPNSFVGVEQLIKDRGGVVFSDATPTAESAIAYQCNDILIGNIRPYLKKIWLADRDGGASGDIVIIRIREDHIKILDAQYLYKALSSDQFFDFDNANTKGAKMPRGDRAAIAKYPIPVPPLSEQKRIVAELDLLQGIIDKQKAQLKELDTLAQSIFYDMFGDPIENDRKWDVQKLGALAAKIANGSGMKIKEDTYKTEGILFFRCQNVWRNRIDYSDIVYIDEETHRLIKNSSLKHNDFLITKIGRVNTENSSLGRVSLYEGEDDKANLSGNLCFIRLKEPACHKFILYILVSNQFRDYIRRTTVGAIDKRAINSKQIESFPIIMPPLSLQQAFATKIEAIERQKASINASIAETQKLFDYTMDKYFG